MKENTRGVMERIGSVALPLMMFLTLTDVSRIVTLVAAAGALIFVLGKKPQLEQRISPLTVAVLIYGAVCLCSGLGSSFGKYAMQESCKILAAFSVFLLALVRAFFAAADARREEKAANRAENQRRAAEAAAAEAAARESARQEQAVPPAEAVPTVDEPAADAPAVTPEMPAEEPVQAEAPEAPAQTEA